MKELGLCGVTVYIDLTSVHAGIKVNDITDRIVEETAKESEDMTDED